MKLLPTLNSQADGKNLSYRDMVKIPWLGFPCTEHSSVFPVQALSRLHGEDGRTCQTGRGSWRHESQAWHGGTWRVL